MDDMTLVIIFIGFCGLILIGAISLCFSHSNDIDNHLEALDRIYEEERAGNTCDKIKRTYKRESDGDILYWENRNTGIVTLIVHNHLERYCLGGKVQTILKTPLGAEDVIEDYLKENNYIRTM